MQLVGPVEAPLVVLAGGQGRRLGGVLKALVTVCGKPLIRHVLDGLGSSFREVIVVVHNQRQEREVAREIRGAAAVIRDAAELQTPLAGIYAAAMRIRRGAFAVAPVDAPFLRPSSYRRMLAVLESSGAAVPRWPNGYIEPLIAVYRAERVLESIPRLLQRRDLSMRGLVREVGAVLVPVDAVFEDPDVETLNVNTPEDVDRAERICSRLPAAPP